MRKHYLAFVIMAASAGTASAGWDPTSKATNVGSIANTRHNLTQSYLGSAVNSSTMDRARNDYGEVCVYCHTPHGSNSSGTMANAPLWNRTKPQATFSVYSLPRMLGLPISDPGVNSLTCLSCHDGATAIDSVINMPGSGGYNKNQENTVNSAFLDEWKAKGGTGGLQGHATLSDCADACHRSPFAATSFIPFIIGADLNNDHPVGVKYPTSFGANVDFKQPTAKDKLAFFDKNGNNRADKEEIRVYDTGEGYEVECASCHDPHGVPTAGAGSVFIPSFLRVDNSQQSAVCLTCHVK